MNHLETFENWKRFQLLEREDLALAQKWSKVAKELIDGLFDHIETAVKEIVELRNGKYRTDRISQYHHLAEEKHIMVMELIEGYPISTSAGDFRLRVIDDTDPDHGTRLGSFRSPNIISIKKKGLYKVIADVIAGLNRLIFREDDDIDASTSNLEDYLDTMRYLRTMISPLDINVLTHELIHYHDNLSYSIQGKLDQVNRRLIAAIDDMRKKNPDLVELTDYARKLSRAKYVNSNWEYNAFFIEGVAGLLNDISANNNYRKMVTNTYSKFEMYFFETYMPFVRAEEYNPEQLKRLKKRIYDLWTTLKEIK